jgi:hypothetical protein
MEDAKSVGEHMSLETFRKTLVFIEHIYSGRRIILVSGGEPTDHPQIQQILNELKDWNAILLSNGLFWSDTKTREMILAYNIPIQVYNDPKYYPLKVEPINHPRVLFADKINLLSPIGRARNLNEPAGRMSPLCFNLRSACKTLKDFSKAVMLLRMKGKICSPSIDIHGNIVAGESRFCHKIGTIDSSFDELLQNTLHMSCNKCGLEDNLSSLYKNAIH